MSQLSLAAEVVWLLELTATIQPNSTVMSIAEEAGITHFKTLLQRWAHSVYCFRRTWVHTKSLFIPKSQCYCHNTVNHESGGTHCVMLKASLEKLTGSFVKSSTHTENEVCVCGQGYCLWIHTGWAQVGGFLYSVISGWSWSVTLQKLQQMSYL